MNHVVAGILLPDTVLREYWFFYLAAFVAFNTIIFVGLSVAKLVIWPKPSIPADVLPEPSRRVYAKRKRYGPLTQQEEEQLNKLPQE